MEMNPTCAILWDVENIHPKETEIIIEKIEETSRIAYAVAFADWTNKVNSARCEDFAKHNFEMIHTPHIEKIKNTADMSLITHGLSVLYHYPNISEFILLTGDADFRPLLVELRKAGKVIKIICDSQSASIDFVGMADNYVDYRDLIEEAIPEETDEESEDDDELTKEQAFYLFEEAVIQYLKEKKEKEVATGTVKVKMKLLNAKFDEKKMGYSTWSKFVKEAVTKTSVTFEDRDRLKIEANKQQKLPKAFKKLIEVIESMHSNADKEGYLSFTRVAEKVKASNYGYKQFKKLALEAEKRKLVVTKQNGKNWQIALCKE